jgi:hypothetical protein
MSSFASSRSLPFPVFFCAAKLVLGLAMTSLSVALVAQENRPPSPPGEITVAEVTAHSARIAWGAANDPDGDTLVYLVCLRTRLDGIAQPWSLPQETRATALVWDGLVAATAYEVKVTAFDGKTFGPARIRERAFFTLQEANGNHPPSTPRGLFAVEVGAHRARLEWPVSIDADNDPVTYIVSVRKRLEGGASDWLPPVRTPNTSVVLDGLESETFYDARVRAFDGRDTSRWFVREALFQTTPDSNAPTRPGEISASGVTSESAVVAWGAANGPAGVRLVYQVQVRARPGVIPQAWRQVAETVELSVLIRGLSPATSYDVQVRAWAQTVPGLWALKERAFITLAPGEVNHPPARPAALEVSDLSPFGVHLSWGRSSDPDGDRVTYAVCLRSRIDGVARPWSRARETERPAIFWDGLRPDTVYEVRIRAWDGKAGSDWYIKEHAFVTPSVRKLSSFIGRADPTLLDSRPMMMIVWPDDSTAEVLESSDSASRWTQCLEIETDGVQNRALLPMDANSRFFRVR